MKRVQKPPQRFVVACLLLSIVPILFLGSAFLVIQANSGRSALQTDLVQKAVTINAAFDRMVKNTESIANHFSLAYMEGGVNTASEIQKQFSTYSNTFALQGTLFFYERGDQTIYSGDGAASYQEFEASHDFGRELDLVSFFTRLNTANATTYLKTRGLHNESNFFLSMYPIPALSSSPEGMLFYVVDNASIQQVIANYMESFSGYYAVFDSNNRLAFLLTPEGELPSPAVTSTLTALKGTQLLSCAIVGEKFVVVRLMSDELGLTHTLAIPEGTLFQALRRRLLIYAGALAAFLVLATLAALLIVRWQTRPIYHLARSIDLEEALDPDGEYPDLFTAMEQRFQTVQNENERLVLQIRSYSNHARARFFEELLGGSLHDHASLEASQKASGVLLNRPAFFVMVFSFQPGADPKTTERTVQLFGEADFRYGSAYAFDLHMENMLGILVNVDEQYGEDLDTLRRKVSEDFLERLRRLNFDPLVCGVSRVRHSALRANQQLFEALAAQKWQSDGVGLFTQEQAEEQQFPFQECEMFRQSLAFGNEPAAQKAMSHLLELVRREHWATDRAQAVFFRLVNMVISLASTNHFPLDSTDLTLAASGAQPEAVEEALRPAITHLCVMLERQKALSAQQTNQAVINYIYQHFADAELSSETLAEEFRLSESAIRKIIREATGTTLLSYVTTLRLAYVKKQLAETELPIKEIVEAAGYIDVSNFTRKFRSLEGVTPGQYRAAMRGQA